MVVELSNQNESYLIKQFRSDDGNGGIKPLVFENLSSGTYTLTIKDQNNQCIDEFTETEQPEPEQPAAEPEQNTSVDDVLAKFENLMNEQIDLLEKKSIENGKDKSRSKNHS